MSTFAEGWLPGDAKGKGRTAEGRALKPLARALDVEANTLRLSRTAMVRGAPSQFDPAVARP
jgi:hypothetical protein